MEKLLEVEGTIEFKEYNDTFQHRESYRQQLEKIAAQKEAAKQESSKGKKGKRKGKGKASDNAAGAQHVAAEDAET